VIILQHAPIMLTVKRETAFPGVQHPNMKSVLNQRVQADRLLARAWALRNSQLGSTVED